MSVSWRQGDVSASLEISEDHINRGKRGSPFNDPISLAIKEATESDWAMTGWGYALTSKGNVKSYWTVSPFSQVSMFLKRWDSYKDVPPITIQVQLDDVKTPPPTRNQYKVRRYAKDIETRLGL
jgi:hypothetical protein